MNYYDRITDMNVLYDAYRKCIKGVDWKSSVQRYEANFLHNLRELRESLINGTYKPEPFTEFQITERGKTRQIKSPCLQDRILQRAMCDYVLEPTLYPYLIYDNGASVIGKGVEFTRKRLRRNLQKYYRKYGSEGYILIGDFSKYFESIPHDKLICSIAKKIHDEKFMQLFELIIKSFGAGKNTGIGIGAQISQICGIYYATPLDNYIRNVYIYVLTDDFNSLVTIFKTSDLLKEIVVDNGQETNKYFGYVNTQQFFGIVRDKQILVTVVLKQNE